MLGSRGPSAVPMDGRAPEASNCWRKAPCGGEDMGGGRRVLGPWSAPPPAAVGHRGVCTTGTVRHKAECKANVKEKSSSVTCHGRLSPQ